MSVSVQELASHYSPQGELEAMLLDSLYSQTEMEAMPLEARMTHFRIADFVRDALDDHLDRAVSPEEGWRMATTFLSALDAAAVKKEVWDGRNMHEKVIEGLANSVNQHDVTPETAPAYLDALDRLVHPGVFGGSYYAKQITKPIARNHDVLRNHADERTREAYKVFLKDPETIKRLGNVIYDEAYYDDEGNFVDTWDIGFDVCEDLLADIGVQEAKKCVKNWGIKPETSKHFKVIAELEHERPGAVALLHNFYGISQFGRYLPSVLIRQYDTHGDTSKPYGVHLKAAADWNKAFSKEWENRVDSSLLEFADKGDYFVRCMEASDTRELYKRMSALNRLYGSTRKISFAVIEAHGTADSMQLGYAESALGSLVLGHNYGTTKKWFIENPTIFLGSCSTGQEHGIAQRLSQKLHATTVAPESPAGVESLEIIKQANRLKFLPIHAHGVNSLKRLDVPLEQQRRMYVDTALYIDGEKIGPQEPRYVSYFAEAKPREENEL